MNEPRTNAGRALLREHYDAAEQPCTCGYRTTILAIEAEARAPIAAKNAALREWMRKHLRQPVNGRYCCIECGAEEGSYHLSTCTARALLAADPTIARDMDLGAALSSDKAYEVLAVILGADDPHAPKGYEREARRILAALREGLAE